MKSLLLYDQLRDMKAQRSLLFAACLAFSVPHSGSAGAPWWDDFPRVVEAIPLTTAQDYHASAAVNRVAFDPGWGPWFMLNQNPFGCDWSRQQRQSFDAAGIRSLSFHEGFGNSFTPILSLVWDTDQQKWGVGHTHWDWQNYSSGDIRWAGAWTWFDSFLNDSPTNQSEFSYFARPFTRMHPTYGGPPMTYPDGTIATGFFDNDPSDPRKSRVYDAGCTKNILGSFTALYAYNTLTDDPSEPHAGELWVPADGKYASFVFAPKDPACPLWADYARASTLAAVQLTGLDGAWTDNISAWDNFASALDAGFGEWSVARFRTYLTNHFALTQLQNWGVLATNATLTDIAGFDVRGYFRNIEKTIYGGTGTNLAEAAWSNSNWANQPVWRAYCIFNRQAGTEALARYDQMVHAAAAQAGATDFALLANDITPALWGWARGSFDLTSAEVVLGWDVSGGSRGFGLPPFGRIGPYCKAAREHGRSRFVTTWLYNSGYETELSNTAPVNAVFYEMLASHALPKIDPDNSLFVGQPATQKALFQFVADQAAPEFGGRVPVEEVGVYMSTSSILTKALPGDMLNQTQQDHKFALWGWGTVLSELHCQYRFVPEWKLTTNLLRTLRVLIVPNAVAFDPPDTTTLQAWIRDDGGCLIVTGDSGARLGESGNFDATNNLVLAPLTGVSDYSIAPANSTNYIGTGVVLYAKANLGRIYYDATASGRSTQRTTLSNLMVNAYNLVGREPMLVSTNAPTTTGLTLYEDMTESQTFVDLNNVNVDLANYTTTVTPTVNVNIAQPEWWFSGAAVSVKAVSPDGALSLNPPVLINNRVYLSFPPVTNYASFVLSLDQVNTITITQQPTNVSANVGGTATFSIIATSSPPAQLSYQWSKNGTAILNATDSIYTTPVLLLNDVGTNFYTARVSVGSNFADSAVAPLVVSPSFTDITNGLIVHLTFDSTMNDSSGRANNATYTSTNGLVNQPAGPTYVPGRIGEAFQFTTAADGSTIEFASLGYPNDLKFYDTNNWSVSIWINYLNGTGDAAIIGNKHWWATSNPGWVLAGQPNGNFRVSMADSVNGTQVGAQRPAIIRDGNWHQLAMTFTVGGTVDVYYDGVLDSSYANTIINGTDTYGFVNGVGQPLAMNIGQDGTGAYNGSNPNAPPAYTTGASSMIDAQIDDVGFWNRALTSNEVAAIYEAGQANQDLSQAVTNLGKINAAVSGGNIILTWTGRTNTRLQNTTDPSNPLSWADVGGTLGANSYSEPVASTPTFYRLREP